MLGWRRPVAPGDADAEASPSLVDTAAAGDSLAKNPAGYSSTPWNHWSWNQVLFIYLFIFILFEFVLNQGRSFSFSLAY